MCQGKTKKNKKCKNKKEPYCRLHKSRGTITCKGNLKRKAGPQDGVGPTTSCFSGGRQAPSQDKMGEWLQFIYDFECEVRRLIC